MSIIVQSSSHSQKMTAGILENHTRKFPASGCEDTRKSGGDIRATPRARTDRFRAGKINKRSIKTEIEIKKMENKMTTYQQLQQIQSLQHTVLASIKAGMIHFPSKGVTSTIALENTKSVSYIWRHKIDSTRKPQVTG